MLLSKLDVVDFMLSKNVKKYIFDVPKMRILILGVYKNLILFLLMKMAVTN
jgi:hypothetical protein